MLNLGRFLALLVVSCSAMTSYARDWYVAPAPQGQSGASGTETAPLDSIAAAIGAASAGDVVYLQRGGTYRVKALSVGKNLDFDAYGEGERPEITESELVTLAGTWSENSAVRTAASAERVVACYVDGRFVPLARYPNEGVVRHNREEGATWVNTGQPHRIVADDLADRPGVSPGRWTGAQVRWRRWHWLWETRPISNHSASNTLELGTENYSDNVPHTGMLSGFYIDNDLDELDAPGEWFWGDGTFYLYPPSSANPATMVVEVVTSSSTGVVFAPNDQPMIRNGGTSRFSNIAFRRTWNTALVMNRPTTVAGCAFEQIEHNAIAYTWDAQPFVIRESIFRDVRNNAISGWANSAGASGSLIEKNLFLRIGNERGYGGSGPWHAVGILIGAGNGIRVRLNRLVEIGYAGILLGGAGQTAERNVIVRAMNTLNDGAGIYTNCDASVMRENIILDTMGDLTDSEPFSPLGHGIWPEFLEGFENQVIEDNTLYGNNGAGIWLPNNFTSTVRGNTSLDNRRSGFEVTVRYGEGTVQNHTIRDNILGVVLPTRRIPREELLYQQLFWGLPDPAPAAFEYGVGGNYGLMSHTTFVMPPSGDAVLVRGDAEDSQDDVSFSTVPAWTSAASWASSEGTQVRTGNAILLFNDTEQRAAMDVPPGSWTDLDGTAVGPTVAVEPFRSVVLLGAGGASAEAPYYAASGVDWRSAVPTTAVLGGPENPLPPLPGGDAGSNPLADAGGSTSDSGSGNGSVDAGADAASGGGRVKGGCSLQPGGAMPLHWAIIACLMLVLVPRRRAQASHRDPHRCFWGWLSASGVGHLAGKCQKSAIFCRK